MQKLILGAKRPSSPRVMNSIYPASRFLICSVMSSHFARNLLPVLFLDGWYQPNSKYSTLCVSVSRFVQLRRIHENVLLQVGHSLFEFFHWQEFPSKFGSNCAMSFKISMKISRSKSILFLCFFNKGPFYQIQIKDFLAKNKTPRVIKFKM